jgi:hypothetical protein
MRKSIILFAAACITIYGCHSREKKSSESVAVEKLSALKFRKVENLRYGFEARVPAGWETNDPSDNGDGFILKLPGGHSGEADIRIYGSYLAATESDIAKDTMEIFRYDDGTQGYALRDGGNFLVERALGEDRFVILSVEEKLNGWIDANMKILMKIAESLGPVGEGER